MNINIDKDIEDETFYIKKVSLNGVPVEKFRESNSVYMPHKYNEKDFFAPKKEQINFSGEQIIYGDKTTTSLT